MSPNKMSIYHQYHSKKYPNSSSSVSNRLLHLNIPPTSSFLYDQNDFLNSNSSELNLLHTKNASFMTSTLSDNYFLKVLPCIRRLYTIFNSICPNIYHIHCSDSLRTLQELLCLIEEYLQLSPSSTISTKELLYNEEYLDDFIHQLRLLPFKHIYPKEFSSTIQPKIRCFGSGIHSSNPRNQLNEKLLFCFEITTSFVNPYFYPVDVLIIDPNDKRIPIDIQYINTYDRGYTRLYSCSYKPQTQTGNYQISFVYNHVPINTEPFTVFIRNSSQEKEVNKKQNNQELPPFELEGDGYSKKVIVNSIARFRLRTNSLLKSAIDLFSVEILDPYGHPIVVQRRSLSPDLLELTYQPMSIGEHKLSISFDHKLQRQLIIHVIHDETDTLRKFKTFGPGLHRAILGLPTEFYIDLNHQSLANHNPLQFSLEPSYQAEIDYEQQMATVRYTPLKEGDCPIHILEYNNDILLSPFLPHITKVSLENEKPKIYVTGLNEQIIVHRPVEFQVHIEHPLDDPKHTIQIEIITPETPSPSVSIQRQDLTLYTCSFLPTGLGRHIISIDYAGIVAENNPFTCEVTQEKDIQLAGPAMTNQCLALNEPTHFYFKLKDFLTEIPTPETNLTYESGYSSNEETSMNSSREIPTDQTNENNADESIYRVTITDGHGNIKPNVSIKDLNEKTNDNIRVDFTPDEKILFINISCTW